MSPLDPRTELCHVQFEWFRASVHKLREKSRHQNDWRGPLAFDQHRHTQHEAWCRRFHKLLQRWFRHSIAKDRRDDLYFHNGDQHSNDHHHRPQGPKDPWIDEVVCREQRCHRRLQPVLPANRVSSCHDELEDVVQFCRVPESLLRVSDSRQPVRGSDSTNRS